MLALVALAGTRFVLGFAYRYGLFRTAHCIEADLRNLVYERLTELSFSYWDRTQTAKSSRGPTATSAPSSCSSRSVRS